MNDRLGHEGPTMVDVKFGDKNDRLFDEACLDAKKAITDANGDFDKAVELLTDRGYVGTAHYWIMGNFTP